MKKFFSVVGELIGLLLIINTWFAYYWIVDDFINIWLVSGFVSFITIPLAIIVVPLYDIIHLFHPLNSTTFYIALFPTIFIVVISVLAIFADIEKIFRREK